MHLQQSHVNKHGGPQYWLQNAPDHILEHIQRHKKCQVILQARSNHRTSEARNAVAGKVGRDRVSKVQPYRSSGRYEAEKITSAAIRLTNGHVYTGLFHGNALEKARSLYADKSESYYNKLFGKSEDGFTTSFGRFVNRDEAYRIAVKCSQMTRKSYIEAIHDLWGDNIKADSELSALAFQNVRTDKSTWLKTFENAHADGLPLPKYAHKKRTSH